MCFFADQRMKLSLVDTHGVRFLSELQTSMVSIFVFVFSSFAKLFLRAHMESGFCLNFGQQFSV